MPPATSAHAPPAASTRRPHIGVREIQPPGSSRAGNTHNWQFDLSKDGDRAWRKSSCEAAMARNDLILTNGTTLVVLMCLECGYGTQVTSTTVIYRRHIQNTVG
jgi:hypothetical protein